MVNQCWENDGKLVNYDLSIISPLFIILSIINSSIFPALYISHVQRFGINESFTPASFPGVGKTHVFIHQGIGTRFYIYPFSNATKEVYMISCITMHVIINSFLYTFCPTIFLYEILMLGFVNHLCISIMNSLFQTVIMIQS